MYFFKSVTDIKDLDLDFKSHVQSRCEDRANALTHPEAQNFFAKLALLKILRKKQESVTTHLPTKFLTSKSSFVGRRYIVDLLKLYSLSDLESELKLFVCFSMNSWSLCKNGHIFPSLFNKICSEC